MFFPAIWVKVALGMLVVGGSISVPVIYSATRDKQHSHSSVTKNKQTVPSIDSYVMTSEEQTKYNNYEKEKAEVKQKIQDNDKKITDLTKQWHVSEVAKASKEVATIDFEWTAMWRKDFVKGIKEKYATLKNQVNTLSTAEQNNKQELDKLIEEQNTLANKVHSINLEMDKLNSYK